MFESIVEGKKDRDNRFVQCVAIIETSTNPKKFIDKFWAPLKKKKKYSKKNFT